jgi:hypothetical protein
MIGINIKDSVVNVMVLGEFTLADYKEFENTILYGIKFQGQINLLLDLRDMLGFTMDVAWEEIKFNRDHQYDFQKVAIVTSDQWLAWTAWLHRLFLDADIEVFDDYNQALEWVESD